MAGIRGIDLKLFHPAGAGEQGEIIGGNIRWWPWEVSGFSPLRSGWIQRLPGIPCRRQSSRPAPVSGPFVLQRTAGL